MNTILSKSTDAINDAKELVKAISNDFKTIYSTKLEDHISLKDYSIKISESIIVEIKQKRSEKNSTSISILKDNKLLQTISV